MKHFSARRNIPPAQQGLTLIGQMMVLLVAGVLGAVALSSWLDLQVRERATDAYNQMEAIKPAANALGKEQHGVEHLLLDAAPVDVAQFLVRRHQFPEALRQLGRNFLQPAPVRSSRQPSGTGSSREQSAPPRRSAHG